MARRKYILHDYPEDRMMENFEEISSRTKPSNPSGTTATKVSQRRRFFSSIFFS